MRMRKRRIRGKRVRIRRKIGRNRGKGEEKGERAISKLGTVPSKTALVFSFRSNDKKPCSDPPYRVPKKLA